MFTPAQRSEGDTPAQLEDDAAETPTALSNGEDKDLATASIPLQPEDDPLPTERFITGNKKGGDADSEDNDAFVDDLIEPSQSMPKKDSIFASEVLSRTQPTGPLDHPTVLDPGSECVLGSPSLAGGDEDADGEADPDYSVNGAKNHHQIIAHQPANEVASSEIIGDTPSLKVNTSKLESHPTR